MSKGSGSTRSKAPGNINTIVLTSGGGSAEISDSMYDYYLPSDVRSQLDKIHDINTYEKLEAYLKTQGIVLDSGSDKIKTDGRTLVIPAVKNIAPQIVTAIETYKSVFGRGAVSSLKKIKLHDDTLDTTAAFHYNAIGEHDPFAGTMRISRRAVDGRVIFHEFAHVLQESVKRRGEDAVSSAARLVGSKFAGSGVDKAEKFADSFSYGFRDGSKRDMDFINHIRKMIKK